MALTDIQKVRLLIGDETSVVFTSDDAIQFFIDDQSDDLTRAAAMGLRAIAASAARVGTLRQTLNTEIDRKTIVDQLLKTADKYDAQSDADGDIEFIEQDVGPFSASQIVHNAVLRDGC